MRGPRYPNLKVKTRSANPFALVSATRQAMRRAGVQEDEIDRFSEVALEADDPQNQCEICSRWVDIDLPDR